MRILTAAGYIRIDDSGVVGGHTHAISDVSGLQSALDGKAASVHTHAQADVTGLVSALAGKSATGHTHVIADVTGLQSAIDGKSATGHTHVKANISDLEVITTTPTLSTIPKADGSGKLALGWLSLATGSIFMGVAGIPAAVAVSGDATLATTGVLTLTTVNSNVGAFTMATVTVNAKGLVTAAATGNPMTTAADIIIGGASGAPTRLAGNPGGTLQVLTSMSSINSWQNHTLTLLEDVEITTIADTQTLIYNNANARFENKTMSGDATLSAGGALTLSTVNSNVGSFTNASITVDAKGRITAASTGSAGAVALSGLTDVAITSIANLQMLIYENATARWKNRTMSGDATLSVSGVLTISANTIGTGKLSKLAANSIIGNPTATNPEDIVTMTATAGRTLRMLAAGVMNWGPDLDLGTTGAGGGVFKCFFAASKYFEITAAGLMNYFNSATAKIEVTATAKTTWTFPSTNTVTIDTTHFVGSSKDVRLREINVCDAGVAKKMLMLCSAAY